MPSKLVIHLFDSQIHRHKHRIRLITCRQRCSCIGSVRSCSWLSPSQLTQAACHSSIIFRQTCTYASTRAFIHCSQIFPLTYIHCNGMPQYDAGRRRQSRETLSGNQSRILRRPPLTHFLCIPLVTAVSKPQLERSLASFTDHVNEVNQTASASSIIPIKTIRHIGTIHLTLGVMSLDDTKLRQAIDLLQSVNLPEILQRAASSSTACKEPFDDLVISLESLASMHDATSTTVLYAVPLDTTSRLQHFCEALRQLFVDKYLLMNENRELKLHATIVNTSSVRSAGRATRLNASQVMDHFKDFVWASGFAIEKVAICKMGAIKTINEAGVITSELYEEIAAVYFNNLT